MECKKCGSLIQDENANFCPECGTEIPRKTGISEGLRNLNAGLKRKPGQKELPSPYFSGASLT
jgi:uncharacterized membrane protein YvbJ